MPLDKVQNQMKWDRRRQPRRTPKSFTFLQLERDEGGRVVDLSEEGLRFESFSPIRTANPVPLWFSFNLRDRIEATGQVVWTDIRKEVGGLVFINLNPVARQLIRAHLAEISAEETVPQAARATGTNGDAVRAGSSVSVRSAGLAVVPRLDEDEVRFPERSAFEFAESPASEPILTEVPDSPDQGPLVPLERFVAATRSQFLRGLLLGILAATLTLIPIFKYALRSQPGATGREAPAASSPVSARVEGDAAAAKLPSAPPSAVDNPAASSKSPSAKPGNDYPGNPLASPVRHVSETPRALANPGVSQLARAASGENAHAKANSANPDQLWQAVQSGNAKAAVVLADLYLRGDGVAANCAQARILLQFAAQKSNPEGIKKSRELEKSGCPTP